MSAEHHHTHKNKDMDSLLYRIDRILTNAGIEWKAEGVVIPIDKRIEMLASLKSYAERDRKMIDHERKGILSAIERLKLKGRTMLGAAIIGTTGFAYCSGYLDALSDIAVEVLNVPDDTAEDGAE